MSKVLREMKIMLRNSEIFLEGHMKSREKFINSKNFDRKKSDETIKLSKSIIKDYKSVIRVMENEENRLLNQYKARLKNNKLTVGQRNHVKTMIKTLSQ